MLAIRIYSGSNVRGHAVTWLPWGSLFWGYSGGILGSHWAPGRLPAPNARGPRCQRQCVATVLFRQRTVHQNDSKFPDASLTLAKTPLPICGPLALFSPSPAALPLASLSTPSSLRLPRRPRPIQPHPSANQSLTLKRPSAARLSPPVRAKAVNDIQTNTVASCSSTRLDQ